jgi:hypothetical protein
MLLVEIPWAQRTWALPFLSVLAPSERYHQKRQVRHKRLTVRLWRGEALWGRQMLYQVRCWLPERPIVLVTDSRAKSGGGFRRFIALALRRSNFYQPSLNLGFLFMLLLVYDWMLNSINLPHRVNLNKWDGPARSDNGYLVLRHC